MLQAVIITAAIQTPITMIMILTTVEQVYIWDITGTILTHTITGHHGTLALAGVGATHIIVMATLIMDMDAETMVTVVATGEDITLAVVTTITATIITHHIMVPMARGAAGVPAMEHPEEVDLHQCMALTMVQ